MRERKKRRRMGPAVKLKLRGTPTVLLRIYIVHSYNRERDASLYWRRRCVRERKKGGRMGPAVKLNLRGTPTRLSSTCEAPPRYCYVYVFCIAIIYIYIDRRNF